MLKRLHDDIAKKYQAGNYDMPLQKSSSTQIDDDFSRGYQQAVHDHQYKDVYRHYPMVILSIGNRCLHGRLHEIVNFVHGYRYYAKAHPQKR